MKKDVRISGPEDGLFAYIDRIEPFDPKAIKIEPYPSGVLIRMQDRNVAELGHLSITFTTSVDGMVEDPSEWSEKPSLILSSIGSTTKKDRTKNPIESIRIIYTLIATIQSLSNDLGVKYHVVRANKYSQPFFEKLVAMGIYYYSDEIGDKSLTKKTWSTNYTLYSAKYPNISCEKLVHKFEIPSFTKAIVDFYKSGIKVNSL